MTVGQRIRARREELGLSQVALAEAINEKKQTVYKYENDIIKNIPLKKALEIAKALDTTIDELSGSEPGILELTAEDNGLTQASKLLKQLRLNEKPAPQQGDGLDFSDLELLEAFREAPEYKKDAIKDLLGLK